MKKIFNFVLALCFLDAFISCAYAHSLIFGPEFFSSEDGKSRQIIKNFSIQDASQRYIVSVQNGASSEKGAIRGGISINGKLIFPSVEMGERPKMFTKYVKLQKKNRISVDAANGAAIPIIVTVMSLKEQTVTARIPPIGNAVDVEGYASIIFPAGTFDILQNVTVSVSASPAMQDIFETNAAGPRLPYEIRVNTGNRPPKKDIEVSVRYPDSFFSSDYQIHVFAHMHDNPDARGRFLMISSGLDDKVNMTMATLPRHAFSRHHNKNGTYEAVITVGLVH